MTKNEAIEALEKGETLTHVYFDDKEWVKKNDPGHYITEDGYLTTKHKFWDIRKHSGWNVNWSVYTPK